MNYDLSKQLKDAGFPQMSSVGSPLNQPWRYDYQNGEYTFIPTLSELIEACGEQFYCLKIYHPQEIWEASTDGFEIQGITPEEAVAKLWLSLIKQVK